MIRVHGVDGPHEFESCTAWTYGQAGGLDVWKPGEYGAERAASFASGAWFWVEDDRSDDQIEAAGPPAAPQPDEEIVQKLIGSDG